MINIDEMKRELPYKENPAYIRDLVGRCRQTTLRTNAAAPARRAWIWAVAAAAAILIAVIGITLSAPRKTPIERFLASITDEEAAMITDYNLEDIPEYVNEYQTKPNCNETLFPHPDPYDRVRLLTRSAGQKPGEHQREVLRCQNP
jgi:hypothetical protein